MIRRMPVTRMGVVRQPSQRVSVRPYSEVETNPFQHLWDDFQSGPSVVTDRDQGYVENEVTSGSSVITGGRLRITPLNGGSGPTGALIFALSPGVEEDAYSVAINLGPAYGTPIAFDARAEIEVTNGAGDGLPLVDADWRFGVNGLREIIDGHLNEIHVGIGNSAQAGAGPGVPATNPNPGLAIEVKDIALEATPIVGAAIYPSFARAPTHPWRIQNRIVRHATNVQLVSVYVRETLAPLESDVGWVRLYTIDRSVVPGPEDDFPTRPVSIPFGDNIQWFASAYSSSLVADVRLEVIRTVFYPTTL